MSIVKRGSTFQLRRRVPQRYCAVEPRGVVWISLYTDSETVARSKAETAPSVMMKVVEREESRKTAQEAQA